MHQRSASAAEATTASGLEGFVRRIIREEIRRIVREDALLEPEEADVDRDLRLRAHNAANRLRRSRAV
ncbi:MAG TPA: hypothetical protein VGM88_02955 [Kofleriaceae bacterium]|jgi:hypothetical protein